MDSLPFMGERSARFWSWPVTPTDPARWAPPVRWQTVLRPPDVLPTSLPPDEMYQKIGEMVLKSPVIHHVE